MTTLDDSTRLRLDRHRTPGNAREALARDVRSGLTSPPKSLLPRWFHEAWGSRLLDEITRLPKFHPTRRSG